MKVRPRRAGDRASVQAFLEQHASARVARLGEVVDPLDHPALVAEEDGRLAGVLTYIVRAGACEILTLHSALQWRGTGTALLAAAEKVALSEGCAHLWVLTTNDNVDALRFYQRRGFELVALNRGAVAESRAHLKPEIPLVGNYGIPLRHEIVLEKAL
jgi:GNAT superfamily N-acetyltransferase